MLMARDSIPASSGIVASVGTLCLALSYVLVSVNAMRAGLLSRFMGILGIIAGGLLIIPLLPGGGSFIQLFWVVALGVLFLDRIEAVDYDVFSQRVRVPTWRKLAVAARISRPRPTGG